MILHKLGDSFERMVAIQGSLPYLVWASTCRITTQLGVLMDSFPCTVVDGALGKKYLLAKKVDTTPWKEGTYRLDFVFVRPEDGYVLSSNIIDLVVSRTGE